MITAKVIKGSQGYISFECSGHAGYKKFGSDIICSAVSMLTINTANSIEKFTDSSIEVHDDNGFISWSFKAKADEKAVLLMDSLILGLQTIEDTYNGKKSYLTLIIEEVRDDTVKPSVICS